MTTTASSVPTDKVACGSYTPIYWSKSDTDKTIAQIKEHNAAWKALCQKKAEVAKPKPVAATFAQRWLAVTR